MIEDAASWSRENAPSRLKTLSNDKLISIMSDAYNHYVDYKNTVLELDEELQAPMSIADQVLLKFCSVFGRNQDTVENNKREY